MKYNLKHLIDIDLEVEKIRDQISTPHGKSDLLDLLEAMRKYGGVTLATNGDNWTCILAEHGSNNRPSKHQIATASTIAEAVIELAEKIVETIKQGV